MNEVINIQIAGQVFYIDRDAYQNLQAYFEKLKRSLSDAEDIDEIFADIEVRVAELLLSRKHKRKEHITEDDIAFVIETIGSFADSDESEKTDEVEIKPARKQIVRNLNNSMIAGVCSGFAERFEMPAGLMRFFFVIGLFMGGLSLLVYLISWITIPAQLIISNKSGKKSGIPWYQVIIFLPFFLTGKIIKFFQRLYNGETKQLGTVLQILLDIVLIGFNALIITLLFLFNEFRWMNSIYQIVLTLIFAGTLIILDIFLLSKIYHNLTYFQRMNHHISKNVKLPLIISTVLLIGIFIYFQDKMDMRDSMLTKIELPVKSRSLRINFDRDDQSDFRPYIRFEADMNAADSTVTIEFYKSAYGSDSFSALENAEQIQYNYSYKDSTLVLADYFKLNQGSLYRHQRIIVRILIPDGMIVSTDGVPLPTRSRSYDYRDDFRTFNYSMGNSIFYWTRYDDTDYLAYDGELYPINRSHSNRLSSYDLDEFNRRSMQILFDTHYGNYYQLQGWLRSDANRFRPNGVPYEIAEQLLTIMMSKNRSAYFQNGESISLDPIRDLLKKCQEILKPSANMERYIHYLESLIQRKEIIDSYIR